MLVEPFLEITALHIMKAARVATVVPGIDASFGVDLGTKGIAPSLGEHLIAVRLGMIAPDQFTHRVRGLFAGIKAWTSHVAGHRGSLRGIEPAVRTPLQA